MNMKEVAALFGVKEKDRSMKNKEKAVEIMEKILACPKCKKTMRWIEGTNACVCPTCTFTVGKEKNKRICSVSKTFQDRSRRFLENNYQYMTGTVKNREV